MTSSEPSQHSSSQQGEAPPANPQPGSDVADDRKAYNRILKSSAVIGGASLINVGIGIVRTKAMAILLGPAGFGVMGLYTSILELAMSVATMGTNSSGVRQMAAAVATGQNLKVLRTAAVLRQLSILLGLLGAGVMIGAARLLSALTFSNDDHAAPIALLALAVFFGCVTGGQAAVIQGMRRIADLAKMNVLGTALGAAATIQMVYFLGVSGLAPSLVAGAAIATLICWHYARNVSMQKVSITYAEVGREAASLLKLGFAFMASALMMTGGAYLVRLILLRTVGVEAAGLYQAAWTLGGLYVGFILQAMGTDFYPCLTGVAEDHVACNRMVNQQAQISLLLAGPGVLATLTFAPLVIALFYAPEFHEAAGVLRWLCLGMALRVVNWPMGYIILAKGAQNVFFWAELAWTVVYLTLAWACVDFFGLEGAGIAFFVSNIFHGFLIYAIVRKLSGFRWLSGNWRSLLLFLAVMMSVFCGFRLLPPWLAMVLGTLAVALSSIWSIRTLIDLTFLDGIPRPLLNLLRKLGLAPLDSRRGSQVVYPGSRNGRGMSVAEHLADSHSSPPPSPIAAETPSSDNFSQSTFGRP